MGELVSDGLVTVGEGAGIIKSNGARADRAGVGYGTAISTLDQVTRARARGGGRGVEALDVVDESGKTQATRMADEVLNGTGPGQLIGQRHEAVRFLAPAMERRVQEAWDNDGGTVGAQFIQQVAAMAGRRDLAGQLPELNAGLLADGAESQKVGNRTIQQWEEFFRTPETAGGATQEQKAIFQRYRREYSSDWQARGPGDPNAPPGAPTG
jgi:hypothetical protein